MEALKLSQSIYQEARLYSYQISQGFKSHLHLINLRYSFKLYPPHSNIFQRFRLSFAAERTSAEIGADGSDDVAIKMIHRDSTFTMLCNINTWYNNATIISTMVSKCICLLVSLFILGGY